MSDEKILKINKRSFLTALGILVAILIGTYILTFFIPKGAFSQTDGTFTAIEGKGYSFFKFLLSPFLLLLSNDNATIIVLSLFILILGGAFNAIDKTDGIKSIIQYLIEKFKEKKLLLLYIVTLFFMLFGSLFGIFEESVTLLPIVVMLSLSMGWDTFTGMGMCLMAAGFGFSSAITNPFTIGIGSQAMGISVTEGILFRIVIFIIMYLILITFLTIHVRRIEKHPEKSPTYESDLEKKKAINSETIQNTIAPRKTLHVYSTFFIFLFISIVTTSSIKTLQSFTIPIIALFFLVGIYVCGTLLGHRFKKITGYFLSGMKSMSPAIILIVLSGSVKLILVNSQTMDTIIHYLTTSLDNTPKILGILFIYLIILIIQFFIGSASAKVPLIIPIISAIAINIGITKNIALLAFIFGDGFTDLIYPTNPVLLVSLGMVSFSYGKWMKKTISLQFIILVVTIGLLILAHYLGY